VQTAGNQLQENVEKMADECVFVRLAQEDKMKAMLERQKKMDNEIEQLMEDILK
jgi:hypothetical protein